MGNARKGSVTLEAVERYWSDNPCGSDQSTLTERRAYFEEIAHRRYALERYIPTVARFSSYRGKKVLEIGCGVGTDGLQFAKAGAIYTGINLDAGSSRLAQECFNVFGVPGSLCKMNAEKMEFPAGEFDHVFSLGVIHHSPKTESIVSEMYRVLKPGGTVAVMVYNKSSLNYYFEIMFLRKLFRYLLIPSFSPRLLARLIGLSREKLEGHRKILLEEKMTHDRWVSINTDGPDCPLAKVYSHRQARSIFRNAGFVNVKTFARFINPEHYGFLGRVIPYRFLDALGRVCGWHLWIEAEKPL